MKISNQIKRSWWKKKSDELSCRQVGSVVHAYLDGEMSDEDLEAVAEHLDKCRDCALEASTY